MMRQIFSPPSYAFIYQLPQVPGVARGKKIRIFKRKNVEFVLAYVTPGEPKGFFKHFSPFGPAVWPAIANIQTDMYERRALLYRLDTTGVWRFIS